MRAFALLALLLLAAGCFGGGDRPVVPKPTLGLWMVDCPETPGALVDERTGATRTVCNVAAAQGLQPVNEPSIAVNPRDPLNLVAGGNDYNLNLADDSYPLGRTPWAGVYASKDGGKTWTQGFIPGHPGDTRPSEIAGHNAAGDAAIAFAPDGTAYYAGIAFRRYQASAEGNLFGGSLAPQYFEAPDLFVARSSDGGVTWEHVDLAAPGAGPLVTVGTPAGGVGAAASPVFNDKEYIAVGPDGTVYVTWTAYQFVGTVEQDPIQLIASRDRGETWSPPVTLSRRDYNQGSVPVVAPDGTLTVVWAEYPGENDPANVMGAPPSEEPLNIVARTSTDGGATFGPHVVVAQAKEIHPAHRTRVNSFPSIAVDPVGSPQPGRLTVVWSANATGDADVFASRSLDAGRTWSTPVRANANASDGRSQYFPWVATSADGVAHVVYFDGDDPRGQYLTVRVASSADRVNWTERAVTDAPFLADQDGFKNDNFLGDYLGIAADASGVYPIWPDTRSAANVAARTVGDTDLFVARLVPAA